MAGTVVFGVHVALKLQMDGGTEVIMQQDGQEADFLTQAKVLRYLKDEGFLGDSPCRLMKRMHVFGLPLQLTLELDGKPPSYNVAVPQEMQHLVTPEKQGQITKYLMDNGWLDPLTTRPNKGGCDDDDQVGGVIG